MQLNQISNIATIYNNLEAFSGVLQRLNVPSETDLLETLSGVEQQDYEQKLRESFDEIDVEQEPNHDLLADMAANQAKRLSEIIFKLLVVYSVFQQLFGLPTLPELIDEISIETEAKSNLDPQIKPCHSISCAPQKQIPTMANNHPMMITRQRMTPILRPSSLRPQCGFAKVTKRPITHRCQAQ